MEQYKWWFGEGGEEANQPTKQTTQISYFIYISFFPLIACWAAKTDRSNNVPTIKTPAMELMTPNTNPDQVLAYC